MQVRELTEQVGGRFSRFAGETRRRLSAVRNANRRFAWVEMTVIAALTLATLSLSGSWASLPTNDLRIARIAGWGGKLDDAELTRISRGMSPYAIAMADRIGRGEQGWTPTGVEGWGVYDLTPPSLVRGALDFTQARELNGLVAPTADAIAPMPAFSVKKGASDYYQALECLTQAVYYEAGFETNEGQEAVAQVVLNRVRHPAYPKSVCGVVYQGAQRATGCQFSFTCDGSLARTPAEAAWNRSKSVAAKALSGFVYEPVGSATHYHADYVFPYWAVTLVKLKQIGAHIFYRITGPMGSPDGFTGRYAGNETILSADVLGGGDARTPDAPSAAVEVAADASILPQARIVTLTIGGETRTYAVSDAPGAVLPDQQATPDGQVAIANTQPIGALVVSQRKPTADEVRAINEKLRSQFGAAAGPAPSGAPVPVEPAP